jgi:predicted transposase YbfD/YdcC
VGHDLPVSVRLRLGIGRRAPSESIFRRVLRSVDAQALDRIVSGWLAERAARQSANGQPVGEVGLPAIAVDGKTARGARDPDRTATHLFAAFDHFDGVVLGQTQVEAKTNEITVFAPLLDRIDVTGTVIIADALQTQDRHAICCTNAARTTCTSSKATGRHSMPNWPCWPGMTFPLPRVTARKGMAASVMHPLSSPPSTTGLHSRTPGSPPRSPASATRTQPAHHQRRLAYRDRLRRRRPRLR